MIADNILYVGVGLTSFSLAAGLVPVAKRIAMACDVTDKPGPGHPHARVTAKLGGAAIIAGFGLPLLVVGRLPFWMGLCTVAMSAVGIADDAWVLLPRTKLVLQLLIVTIFAVTFHHLGYELRPWLIALITVFWLTTTTNSFNLIDGLDGLACGIGIIACVATLIAAILEGNRERALQAVALGAALLGFLPYNLHPATIFMGDGGSLPVGFLLGLLSFQVGDAVRNSSILATYVLPLFVVLVPLLDAGTVIITRLATGRPISARGLDHFHHRLLALGLSCAGAVLFCWALAITSAMYSVAASIMARAYLVLTLPMVCLALAPFALFLIDLAFEVNSPGAIYGRAHGIARMILSVGYRLRLVEVMLDLFLAAASYFAVFLLWTNFRADDGTTEYLLKGLPWVLAASCLAFYATRIYRGMWHYVGIADVVRFGTGAAAASLLVMLLSAVKLVPFQPAEIVLFGIMLFDFLLATRVSLRLIRRAIGGLAPTEWRILLVGAHPRWEDIVHECMRRTGRRTKAVGFVDDDIFMHGRLIGGVGVLGPIDAIEKIYSSTRFDELVITDERLRQDRLVSLLEFAQRQQLRLCNYSVQLEELVGDRALERSARTTIMQLSNG
jgi:UDP-GlcNAc:undecaprenyl-phosphate/decaprenyl-phosphate GlcNAc-1-phosphate transferase